MKAHHIMSAPVISVKATTPLTEISYHLFHNCIDSLPVVDEQGQVIGMVTCEHLFNPARTAIQDFGSVRGLTAEDVMETTFFCVKETTPIREITQLITEQDGLALTVLKNGQLVGIVCEGDVRRMTLRTDMSALSA